MRRRESYYSKMSDVEIISDGDEMDVETGEVDVELSPERYITKYD